MQSFLTPEKRIELKKLHKKERDKRLADRLKIILYLDEGKTYTEIAQLLFLDDNTVREAYRTYTTSGEEALFQTSFTGGLAKLTGAQTTKLKTHLTETTYLATNEIIAHIGREYHVFYSISGLTQLLHRFGFTYKKPKLVPGKADANAQKEFLAKYTELKKQLGPNDKIYFADGVHPQHNSRPAYGWILKGTTRELKANTGRQRLNLNGVLDVQSKEVIIREDERINAESVINLFRQIEGKNSHAEKIYVILDNARYNHAKAVREFLITSKIKPIFLPPYSPNLNLIERLWRLFQKKTLYNKYYEKFSDFRLACLNFFQNIEQVRPEMDTLLVENFQIIGT